MLTEVQECFLKIARYIAERENLLIVAPHIEEPRKQLEAAGLDMDQIRFLECSTNDT